MLNAAALATMATGMDLALGAGAPGKDQAAVDVVGGPQREEHPHGRGLDVGAGEEEAGEDDQRDELHEAPAELVGDRSAPIGVRVAAIGRGDEELRGDISRGRAASRRSRRCRGWARRAPETGIAEPTIRGAGDGKWLLEQILVRGAAPSDAFGATFPALRGRERT